MAEHDDLRLAECPAKIVRQLDAVVGDPVEGHARGRGAIAAVGVSGATLVPLDDGEHLFPGAVVRGLGPLGLARAAMNHQQHRIAKIIAADVDPLIEPAKRDKQRSIDLGWRITRSTCGCRRCAGDRAAEQEGELAPA